MAYIISYITVILSLIAHTSSSSEGMLHIAAFSTKTNLKLFSCWLKWMAEMISIDSKASIEMHYTSYKNVENVTGNGHFMDSQWRSAVHLKVKFVESLLHQKDEAGKLIISPEDALLFTDVDVMSLGMYSSLMRNMKHDLTFMSERPDISAKMYNTGFYLVRNNENVRSFFKAWYAACKQHPEKDDQTVANELLHAPRQPWDVDLWDSTFVCRTNKPCEAKTAIAVHAVGVGFGLRKLRALQKFWAKHFAGNQTSSTNVGECVEIKLPLVVL